MPENSIHFTVGVTVGGYTGSTFFDIEVCPNSSGIYQINQRLCCLKWLLREQLTRLSQKLYKTMLTYIGQKNLVKRGRLQIKKWFWGLNLKSCWIIYSLGELGVVRFSTHKSSLLPNWSCFIVVSFQVDWVFLLFLSRNLQRFSCGAFLKVWSSLPVNLTALSLMWCPLQSNVRFIGTLI